MWISRRTDYATRAVLVLALRHGGGPVKITDIAQLTDTPVSVLEQIMPQLRSAGVVRSERGPSGGFRLNHPPAEVTLGRIVRIMHAPLALVGCATRTNSEPCTME